MVSTSTSGFGWFRPFHLVSDRFHRYIRFGTLAGDFGRYLGDNERLALELDRMHLRDEQRLWLQERFQPLHPVSYGFKHYLGGDERLALELDGDGLRDIVNEVGEESHADEDDVLSDDEAPDLQLQKRRLQRRRLEN